MPLFGGNKFTPKKTPPRKSPSLSNLSFDNAQQAEEFGLDVALPLKLKLGQNEILFEDDGQWITESPGGGGGANHKDLVKLRKQNQQLTEENNLLKIKMEILLDMLSEQTLESLLQGKEMEDLKAMAKRKR